MPIVNDRDAIVDALCRLAGEQVGVNRAEVTLETNLFVDLNYDSLDAVEYAMRIEEEFDVSVPDDRAQAVRTVRNALDAVLPLLDRAVESSARRMF